MQKVFAETPKKVILFAFPYAGGSAAAFGKWRTYMDDYIDFIPVELAGRGRRMAEGAYSNLGAAVDDLFNIVVDQTRDEEFAFFGHSMGSLLAHELAMKMRSLGLRMPKHIFFSGRGAIQVNRSDEKIYHLMSDNVFIKEILQLGGTPPEFFEYSELMDIFLPLIKSDFTIIETRPALDNFKPLNIDITVFNGSEDNITEEQHEGWKDYTNGNCYMYMYEGDHFFLNRKMMDMIEVINTRLLEE